MKDEDATELNLLQDSTERIKTNSDLIEENTLREYKLFTIAEEMGS